MTNAELIQAIRKEIERLIEESDFDESANLYSLLSFLSTLESEKGLDVTDFCKPIDPGIAQCIADHSWEMLGEDEKPVPNGLEEAAGKRLRRVCNLAEETKEDGPLEERLQELKEIRAKKDLDEAAKEYCPDDAYPFGPDIINKEVRKAFIAGYNLCKEQMLKDAVEGTIVDAGFDDHTALVSIQDKRYDEGDKVRIIIVKEDEK